MENYDELIKDKKYDELIAILFEKNKNLKSSNDGEIKQIKSEILILNQKIKYLEVQNKKMMRDHNISIIHKFSNELFISMNENDFEYFKDIIETENFPVNEYLMDELENVNIKK